MEQFSKVLLLLLLKFLKQTFSAVVFNKLTQSGPLEYIFHCPHGTRNKYPATATTPMLIPCSQKKKKGSAWEWVRYQPSPVSTKQNRFVCHLLFYWEGLAGLSMKLKDSFVSLKKKSQSNSVQLRKFTKRNLNHKEDIDWRQSYMVLFQRHASCKKFKELSPMEKKIFKGAHWPDIGTFMTIWRITTT